ncbi:MAG: hypothetical protein ACR2HN_01275 [Tepidiformaceae bacterium]
MKAGHIPRLIATLSTFCLLAGASLLGALMIAGAGDDGEVKAPPSGAGPAATPTAPVAINKLVPLSQAILFLGSPPAIARVAEAVMASDVEGILALSPKRTYACLKGDSRSGYLCKDMPIPPGTSVEIPVVHMSDGNPVPVETARAILHEVLDNNTPRLVFVGRTQDWRRPGAEEIHLAFRFDRRQSPSDGNRASSSIYLRLVRDGEVPIIDVSTWDGSALAIWRGNNHPADGIVAIAPELVAEEAAYDSDLNRRAIESHATEQAIRTATARAAR